MPPINTPLYYFGTDLTNYGHHFFELKGTQMLKTRNSFSECPFNPDALPYRKLHQTFANGTSQFHVFAGFSIYAIKGSCTDKREGTKSVFFLEKELTKEEMKELILDTPVAVRMIDQMPFEVQW